MTEAKTVAFFGGSFNPPHVGHVLAVAYALSTAPIDEVLVVPVYRHPFAKALVDYEHRRAMCELALGWLPGVRVSDVERELGGESRTLRTLQHLRDTHPRWRLRLLFGADVLADAAKWYRFDEVVALAPPVVLGRAGFAVEGAPEPVLPEVSSSEVRAELERGGADRLSSKVPARVLAYVREHGLYRSGVDG